MRALLDTHVWLWMLTAPERLGRARPLVDDVRSQLLLSAASVWEIAIKSATERLVLPEPVERFVPDRMRRTGVVPVAIEPAHALGAATLPPWHRDPFDRLLVAQARALGVPLVTADAQVMRYDVQVIAVSN